jgi:ferrochelatase
VSSSTRKKGIVFFNLGGPDSLEAVKPFLYNLFSDPDIIRLPLSWLMQKPLAWFISTTRGPSVVESYRSMGGRSPILPLTQAQALGLEAALREEGHDIPVYIAMRYWHPFTEEAVDQILKDGIEELILFPLYPHYSLTTTGSSVNELNKVLAKRNITHLKMHLVEPYYNHPTFQAALAETIEEGLAENEWSCPRDQVQILFSAHSLPKKFVQRTQDVYPGQIYETCKLIIDTFFPGQPWELAYQSKVGKMPWLGPDTEGVIHYFAAENIDNVLMVPVSFVSDHLETLYEIDQLYLELAHEVKIPNCHRTKALNDRPLFIKAMTTLVLEKLAEIEAQNAPKTLSVIPH